MTSGDLSTGFPAERDHESSDQAKSDSSAGSAPAAHPAHAGADSAGTPWAGRTFAAHDTAYASDDGTADAALEGALLAFRAGTGTEVAVVDALRTARLLIPLLAHAGEEGVNEHGVTVDKTQELAIVTVEGPGGRTVLPAFTSVSALSAWDASARPVPSESRRVALAAASEGTELMVLDPGSPTEFGVRRPALWALAEDVPWAPAWLDAEVAAAFLRGAASEPAVASVAVGPGSQRGSLVGPEVAVSLSVRPGLDRAAVEAMMGRIRMSWSTEPLLATAVDSLAVRLIAAD